MGNAGPDGVKGPGVASCERNGIWRGAGAFEKPEDFGASEKPEDFGASEKPDAFLGDGSLLRGSLLELIWTSVLGGLGSSSASAQPWRKSFE